MNERTTTCCSRNSQSLPAGQRGARYRCAMVFVRNATDAAPIVAEAAWEGRIGLERRGSGGFGYDPLFIVAGDTRTAAEMPPAEKNRLSHRGQALAALAAPYAGCGLHLKGTDPFKGVRYLH